MTEPPSAFARLDHLAVLEVSGEDRTSWLQGQVTNDVYAYVDGGTMHAFHLDAQGRIKAEVEAVHSGGAWLLLADATVATDLVGDLDRRIVMEDVAVRLRPELVVYAAWGASVESVEARARWESDRFGDLCVELAVESSATPSVEASMMGASAKRLVLTDLETRRTLAGRPRFGVDFGTTTLPQETGMHRRTVSFTKGCYVGQEPVVMIEHRGKPPRRTVVLELAGTAEAPFDLVRADGSVAGRCTSLAVGADGTQRGLGILKRADAVVGGELRGGETSARITAVLGDAPSGA